MKIDKKKIVRDIFTNTVGNYITGLIPLVPIITGMIKYIFNKMSSISYDYIVYFFIGGLCIIFVYQVFRQVFKMQDKYVELRESTRTELDKLKEELKYTKIISNYRANQIYQSIDNNPIRVIGENEEFLKRKEKDKEREYFKGYLDKEPIARNPSDRDYLLKKYVVYPELD